MEAVNTTQRLAELRRLMLERKIDIYIVPSEDAHSSEYIAPCDARREFICGFTGSAGCAVVSADKAVMATDGRYFNQAARQLDGNWELLKQGIPDVPLWGDWVATASAGGKVVGVDPTLLSASVAMKLAEKIKNGGGSDLVPVEENLVDMVWGNDKPARPSEPVKVLGEEHCGKAAHLKLKDLQVDITKKKGAGFVVSALDDIAWLLNLRGSDIPYNPVFFSYAMVFPTTASLYVDESKLTEDCFPHLANSGYEIKPYDQVFKDAEALRPTAVNGVADEEKNGEKSAPAKFAKFSISNKASWALKLALGGDEHVDEIRSPIGDAKAVKNETELEGMRQCHIRDGAALTEYFAWLEDQLLNKGAVLDEVAGADKLEELRAKHDKFVGLSFDTISSTGANAAVIHYKPERGACETIDPKAIYLCDSGGQYLDGTTDTTRTLHFGTPTTQEKKAYTLVLKGNIALDMAIFPKATTGFALDAFARQFLWQEGMDYRHGTGHGVGSYLNVHEGPIGIGTRKTHAEVGLAAGNVTSIEPGYYEDGSFGIRIENMALVKEVKTTQMFGDKPYLGFEHVTLVPYCRNLVDASLLTDREKTWLNDYNKLVLDKTKGFFKDDPLTMAWLERETRDY